MLNSREFSKLLNESYRDIPDPSMYRAGDETNPGSPFYKDPWEGGVPEGTSDKYMENASEDHRAIITDDGRYVIETPHTEYSVDYLDDYQASNFEDAINWYKVQKVELAKEGYDSSKMALGYNFVTDVASVEEVEDFTEFKEYSSIKEIDAAFDAIVREIAEEMAMESEEPEEDDFDHPHDRYEEY